MVTAAPLPTRFQSLFSRTHSHSICISIGLSPFSILLSSIQSFEHKFLNSPFVSYKSQAIIFFFFHFGLNNNTLVAHVHAAHLKCKTPAQQLQLATLNVYVVFVAFGFADAIEYLVTWNRPLNTRVSIFDIFDYIILAQSEFNVHTLHQYAGWILHWQGLKMYPTALLLCSPLTDDGLWLFS